MTVERILRQAVSTAVRRDIMRLFCLGAQASMLSKAYGLNAEAEFQRGLEEIRQWAQRREDSKP